jgi:hypothetical protein
MEERKIERNFSIDKLHAEKECDEVLGRLASVGGTEKRVTTFPLAQSTKDGFIRLLCSEGSILFFVKS